jgi:hypothetical protein
VLTVTDPAIVLRRLAEAFDASDAIVPGNGKQKLPVAGKIWE